MARPAQTHADSSSLATRMRGATTTCRQGPAQRLRPLDPGCRVAGRFLLEAPLGRGGQGVVYRAYDLERQTRCALKLTWRSSGRRRRAPILAEVRHSRVQELLGWGSEGGLDYSALRLYEGHDLQSLLQTAGPLGARRARALGIQLFMTLSHLHRRGVIHRDVKPSNALVSGGRLILIDFDLAARVGEAQRRGLLIGTPLYMSIERLRGNHAGPADDVFSGAVALFELASGRLPSDDRKPRNLEELRAARLRPPAPRLGSLDAFFRRALSPRPQERFDTALAAAVALARAEAA